jgi:hypothetical protein
MSKKSSVAKNSVQPGSKPATRRKVTSNHRLTPEAKRLLILLAEHLGLDQTGVIETLIREKARAEEIK